MNSISKAESDLLVRIIRKYNLPKIAKVFDLEKGYRNKNYPLLLEDSTKVNVIFYKSEPQILERINAANYLSDYLYSQNFPTRHTIKLDGNAILKLSSTSAQKYVCVYNYLPGNTIPWEAYTQKHIKIIGASMSRLHNAIKDLPQGLLPKVSEELMRVYNNFTNYFAQPPVQQALEAKIGINLLYNQITNLRKFISELDKRDKQPIHLDFVRSNILFNEKTEITGIIDFEKASYGPPIVDIARTLAFLIVDCKYKEQKKVQKYFLHSGYEKRGGQIIKDFELLVPLLKFFWIYDFYKFLLHNPYEDLINNEHFNRTVSKLISANLIQQKS